MSVYTKANIIQVPSGYKSGKLYSLVPSNGAADFFFSRSTTGKRAKSNGILEDVAINTPRLDYQGTANDCPALLLEPQRTNGVFYSTWLTSTTFSKFNTTFTDSSLVNPSGLQSTTNKTTLVTQSSSTNTRFSRSMYYTTPGNTYSTSVFVKQGNLQYFHFNAYHRYAGTTTTQKAVFDLTNNQIDHIGTDLDSAKIEQYPNQWYRCTITYTISGSPSYSHTAFFSDVNTSSLTSGVIGTGYIWGFQEEPGAYSSSLITTGLGTGTRNADFCNRNGLSTILNINAGTIYVEAELFTPKDDFGRLITISDGTSANRLSLIPKTGNLLRVYVQNNGATQVDQDVSISYETKQKIAVSYSASQVRIYVNGTLAATDSTVNVFTALDRINFAKYDNVSTTEARIYNATYFDTELTPTEMAALTTL